MPRLASVTAVFPSNHTGQRLANLFTTSSILSTVTVIVTLCWVPRGFLLFVISIPVLLVIIIHHAYTFFLLRKNRTLAVTDNPSAEARFARLRSSFNYRVLLSLAGTLAIGGLASLGLILGLNWYRPEFYRYSATFMPLVTSCLDVAEAGVLVVMVRQCRKLMREAMLRPAAEEGQ